MGSLELPRLISGGYHERCVQHKYIHAHGDFNQQFDYITGYTTNFRVFYSKTWQVVFHGKCFTKNGEFNLTNNRPFDGDTSRDVELM